MSVVFIFAGVETSRKLVEFNSQRIYRNEVSETHFVENSLRYSCHKILGCYFFDCGSFLYFFVMVSCYMVAAEH